MRVCLISYDVQEFGGLEEYAANLAIGLKQQGQEVSYLSCAWVAPENQYAQRLAQHHIPLVQPPRWLSALATDWPTKEKILRGVMLFLTPLTFLLGLTLALFKRRAFTAAWTSAYNFLNGRIMNATLGHDYRPQVGRWLLNMWQRRWRTDIYHIQGYTTTLLFAIEWAHARGIPVVYEEHQTPDPQFNWWKGFEASINLADRVIAVSEKSAEGLRDVCKVTRPIVVRGPLLSDPFDGQWTRAYDFPVARPFTITTLARLYVTKGLTYLLDAAALVKQKYPNVEFKVYGEGDLREELLAKAARLGLDGDAIFPGAFASREELKRILTHTDAFLLSSILEGQPLVIVEAMAYGCPIVTTNVGGIPELIQDTVNGLLCPPEQPECLAEKLGSLIESQTLREQLGRAAREFYVNSPFEARVAGGFFIKTYGEVLEERNRPVAARQ